MRGPDSGSCWRRITGSGPACSGRCGPHAAVLDGEWVALLGYGPAVLRCTARDQLALASLRLIPATATTPAQITRPDTVQARLLEPLGVDPTRPP